MRNKTMLDLIKFQVKELNKYLNKLDQRIELSEEKVNTVNEKYREIYWYRSVDQDSEIYEHVFSGDELELFGTLTGVNYGIKMRNYKLRCDNNN